MPTLSAALELSPERHKQIEEPSPTSQPLQPSAAAAAVYGCSAAAAAAAIEAAVATTTNLTVSTGTSSAAGTTTSASASVDQLHSGRMSPEQEASPPPAAPGASPPPPTTQLPPSPSSAISQQDTSDVEQFAGKIVYNPDGSAYIIEDSESETESSATYNTMHQVPEIVPPLQAVYVSRMLRQTTAARPNELPAVHSYRVISLRDARPPRPTSLPVKPILMCFVCKLSFGFARSFANHAQSEHGVTLNESEREVLAADCSAILQCVGADKRPMVSLLEPLSTSPSPDLSPQQHLSSAIQAALLARTSEAVTLLPPSETPPCSSRNTLGKSPSPPFAHPPAFLTGTTIGVCPDHLQGRPSGAECARCEMILASGRLGPAGLGNVHSRNSCKTLKCPKCNWHYKYQETLEIHMKEKHPEAETSCIYCIAGQPHPRLARGETYTCGYKPYRCEVCNYSTTTKGNLSIHMQSDKHLNNMQELQNGGAPNAEVRQSSPKAPPPLHHSPVSSGGHKPKPSFRCDVCNYETNVARNLRIHMTSEKHTHNMLVLQQNVKHMQTLSALHHQQQQQQQQQQQLPQQHLENLYGMYPGLGDKPEAALADMAYNQALLIQMMTGGQLPGHAGPAEMAAAGHADMGLNPETMEPPPEPADPDPDKVYQCCVCNIFNTDNLEDLGRHLSLDRTRLREQEILAVVAGHYVCKLCTYKTNLKANFQLHCKTDKHLQRLQHVNHVKEGGPRNEWKLKYASAPGGVQIRCNACDYYTNSAHKLQLHAAGGRHEAGVALLKHLVERCATLLIRPDQVRVFHCSLCTFSTTNRLPLLQHVRSLKHLHMEQLHQLQRRAEGKETPPDMGDVFHVVPGPIDPHTPERRDSINSESTPGDTIISKELFKQELLSADDLLDADTSSHLSNPNRDTSGSSSHSHHGHHHQQHQHHTCPFCEYNSDSEMRLQAHILAQHGTNNSSSDQAINAPINTTTAATTPSSSSSAAVTSATLTVMQASPAYQCPLCQDSFKDRVNLERHVMQIHSVNSEGLQRLLMLVDQSHWLNQSRTPTPNNNTASSGCSAQTPGSHNNNNNNQLISPAGSVSSKDSKLDKTHDSLTLENDRDLMSPASDDNTDYELERCGTCLKNFKNIDELCYHQNETGHLEIKQTPSGLGYMCWKKGCNQFFPTAHLLQMHFKDVHAKNSVSQMSVSEKHVYKYRCNQCSLAFKTLEKLQLHSQYHMIRDATKCVLCGRSFRSLVALHKHVESVHSELTDEELTAYKQSLMNNPLLLAGLQGQVLDSSTNDILKKESLRTDDTESLTECDDNKEINISHDDSNQNDGENSDDSIIYKDQQFLEDYLNSQAIAEDSYNDPNRKYKCHRCKVAFTRQSYLTAHNKTLLHRKGEKLSYPMEKYLDPNRPYKCDVCKESFTQKNILLVHYNSVSHLHKLKRAMQEQQQNNNNNSPVSPVIGQQSQSQQQNLSLTPKSTSSEEDEKKRYRCNICKVAYTQGSTLDIHMRSVLHQTRASKLQDLALAGQIDLSKPLIEQPAGGDAILSPKQGTSPTPCSGGAAASSGDINNKPSATPPSPGPGSACGTTGSQLSQGMMPCPKCGALFTSLEQLSVHQQLYCMFSMPMAIFQAQEPGQAKSPPLNNSSSSVVEQAHPSHANEIITTNSKMLKKLNATTAATSSSHIYKHLLESFGFDLVMQYNEGHQRRQQRLQREHNIDINSENNGKSNNNITSPQSGQDAGAAAAVDESDAAAAAAAARGEEDIENSLPEVSRSSCQHCNKEFSSVWVLKSHCEEVHKDLVPIEYLEKYAQQFKMEFDKKQLVVVTTSTPAQQNSATTVQRVSSPPDGSSGVATGGAAGPTTATASNNNINTSASDLMSTPEKLTNIGHHRHSHQQHHHHHHHAEDESKEVLHAKLNLNTPPQEATSTASSTPTSSSTTPASTTAGDLPANIQAMIAQTMAQNPMAFAQQMSEMQAALNVMQLQQLNFNPMMQMMGIGLPLGLNALAAMNLQPPLVPLMMPPPAAFDPMAQFGGGVAAPEQQAMMAKQQAVMMQQQAAVNAAANQKRARTRITDDQLKILRAHFDINNSPSEEQIHEMAGQSGLPPKVIKHWFRNTLFKERQRNKDSPYNFNNPPSTTLNLEEYEKTGEAKVMPLNSSGSSSDDNKIAKEPSVESIPSFHASDIKTEMKEESVEETMKFNHDDKLNELLDEKPNIFNLPPHLHQPPQSPASSMSSTDNQNAMTPGTPNNLNLTSIIASQLGDNMITTSTPSNLSMTPTSPASHPLASPMLPPPKLNQQNFHNPGGALQGMIPQNLNRCLSPNRDYMNSNSNSSTGSTGKRANRTRFTDYQIKVLQEFFENNAYPKDDDLEYLSKLLSLSPRVIVVWFQNARQKARKVYENQPAAEPAPGIPDEAGANRFQRTPGLNYQCKKCLLVFQRYYELIRHQKTHCFKEEDAKRSAQAQAAAAQIAAVLSSEDSNSSTTIEQNQQLSSSIPPSPQIQGPSHSPVQPNPSTTPTSTGNTFPNSPASASEAKEGTFQCDKCNLVFPRFDLWREHQLVHIMNPNLFPSYPPDSPFGILQQHAHLQQHMNTNIPELQSNKTLSPIPHPLMNMLNNVTAQKRKLEEYDGESDVSDQPKDKRLRTTILPEQLDYLYQKYQIESNPSRKMLENIAREVGLKKRVVQVWFQNTRARERKGQFRAHAQVINKRCPFCPALFKVKSALESHLTTKHADQCARGEINIDALPDEEASLESAPSLSSGGDNKFNLSQQNMMPPLFPTLHPDMENSIKKYYEESMKRYISELQAHASNGDKSEIKTGKEDGEIPLDLSKPVDLSRPMKVNMDHERNLCDPGPLTDLSEKSLCDERSDSMSETAEYYDDESNPTSPASSTQSNQHRLNNSSASNASKRFRTQMSSVQVKVMKILFGDYKTPTMAECEMLGREIGLPKRVVQVWFQNARAKEKKGKIALQKVLGPDGNEIQQLPEDCRYCSFKYSHKFSIQDHIFTKSHIGNVRIHLENNAAATGSKDLENTEFMVPQIPGGSGAANNADSTTNPQQQQHQALNNNTHLQLLQMAGMHMNKSAGDNAETDANQEAALFQQLYALGNAGSFPNQTQFMHHPMFAANGGAGGLLLDTGAGPSFLPLPSSVLDQITNNRDSDNSGDNPTIVRMPDVAGTLSRSQLENLPVRECDIDVCFVCKKCRVAFPNEGQLIHHQPQCYHCLSAYFGSFRIVQTGYECQLCPGSERCKSLQDLRKHCETEGHLKVSCALLPPPAESPLSHEMEDVVNQITLLAARAAAAQDALGVVGAVPSMTDAAASAASVTGRALDSNANAFCQPSGESKRRFLAPGGDVATQQQPITSVTH